MATSEKIAVITGAGSGIGRATALALHADGFSVVLAGRRRDMLEQTAALAKAAPPGMLVVPTDVTDPGSIAALFDTVKATYGRIDLLFNNAGTSTRNIAIEDLTYEQWSTVVATNLTGAFLCARRALPGMKALGYGRVLGLGAAVGKSGGARSAAYAASKAGLMTLVKSVAAEYARDGVTANVVAPALIDTQLMGATREVAGRVPVGRLGTAPEVAAAVAFLVSSEAGYITGEVLDINGGTLID